MLEVVLFLCNLASKIIIDKVILSKMKEKQNKEANPRLMAITLKAVVLNDKNQVLLLRRAKKTMNGGKWDLPGGHIDAGETIEEAIKREVKEETGLSVEMGDVIRVVEFEKDHELFKHEKRGMRFVARRSSGEVKLNKKEHDKFEWLEIEQAIEKLEDDGFEGEKKRTLMKAKEHLELMGSTENWKKAIADFENYKKRNAKSNEEFKKYCTEGMILELLPVLDNFEAATEHVPSENNEDGWVVGIMHIQKQLRDVLENHGVSEIATKKGDKIDERIHEVVMGDGKKKKMKVTKVLKKGYQIGERVIRAASVEVA